MASWEWPSLEDKLEAIGYLAVPGVISSVEATVPKGKTEQFRKEYQGKFSDEYPYEANKYGKQFRIYLNDIEGCPEFLKSQLDGAYGARINNTEFIDELVKEYGFKFIKGNQDCDMIRRFVYKKHPDLAATYFNKGFSVYTDFIQSVEKRVKSETELPRPNILRYSKKIISSKTQTHNRENNGRSALTPSQTSKLGWVGEEYVAILLRNKDSAFLKELGISEGLNYETVWFNEGVQFAEEVIEPIDRTNLALSMEYVKKWEDQSVGKGCDIMVSLEDGSQLYIEIKTSKREYPYFNMTSSEMQKMEEERENYFLVKVNNIERILKNESPDVIVISDPFEKLFHPKQIKEATFIIGGRSDEC